MTPATKTRLAMLIGAAAIVAVVLVMRQKSDDQPATSQTTEATSPTPPATTTTPAAPSIPPTPSAYASAISSGTSYDLGTALAQTNKLTAARAAYAKGDYKGALEQIESYEKFPEPVLLKEEMTILKIQVLPHVGRRTDALSLAMSLRDDPAYDAYRGVIDDVLIDSGLRQP